MSGETIEVWGTQKSLETNGSAIPNGSLLAASAGTYDKMSTDGNGFPDAQFVLSCQFGTAPAEGSVISLVAQPLALDGASANAQTPEPSRLTRFIGNFIVNDVTSMQHMELMATDLPPKALYYLYNANTGQSISAGWVLRIKPRTYKAAP